MIALIALVCTSCNNRLGQPASKLPAREKKIGKPTSKTHEVPGDDELEHLRPAFTKIDPAVSAFINLIVSDYLKIRDGLAADDAGATAAAAGTFRTDLEKLDRARFTREQWSLYQNNEDDLKENVEHIHAKKVLEHQREHFGMLSEDMSELVKAFGYRRPLYTDHCPMADKKRGLIGLAKARRSKTHTWVRAIWFAESLQRSSNKPLEN